MAQSGKDLSFPMITSASHWWHWRQITPVNPSFFFFPPLCGGHVCLYRSAAYVAQLLPAEAAGGRGSFALSLGNGAVGKQESEQCTLD